MINKIKTHYVIIFLFLVSTQVYASNFTLSDINVNGLTRTRYSTVLKISKLEVGMAVDKNTADEVRQRLLEAGIFRNDVSVLLSGGPDGNAVIDITLEDRWTFIPLPVGFVSTDSWLAGAVVIQSNLAGLNQTLVAGTFASDDYFQGFSAWANPSFLGSDYSFGLSGSFYFGGKEHLDITGEEILGSFDQSELSSRIQLGNTFFTNAEWNISTGVKWLQGEDSTGYLQDYEDNLLYWQNGISLSWDNLYYRTFFNEGWSLRFETTLDTSFQDMTIEPAIDFHLSRSLIVARRHLLKVKINMGFQNSNFLNPLYIGGTEGSRALPSGDVAVQQYASGVASFEPVIFNPSWGIFTVPLYYEGGVLEPLQDSDSLFWHGPGVGFRFYVDKVAIPALGADFTWDIERGTFKVAVSVGGSGGGM